MSAPVQYAHVPRADLLGGPSVRCARCSSVLRPGQERAVQIEPSGAARAAMAHARCPSGCAWYTPRDRARELYHLAASRPGDGPTS